MKKIPWLIPTVAIVVALGLGASAAAIGTRFAEPNITVVDAATESVPVIAPVGYGDEAPPADLDGDPETIDVSPVVGTATVPLTEEETLSPSVTEALDALTLADDPGAIDPATSWSSDPSTRGSDDPCAPRDGAAPDECPEGVRSTILALTMPPELWVLGEDNPGPLDSTTPESDFVSCEASAATSTELQYGVATNAPATITMTYWPSDDPSDVRTQVFLTDPADRPAWDAALANPGAWYHRIRVQHCALLGDLEAHQEYTVELNAIDVFGREATYSDWFRMPEDRTIPPIRVVPFTNNIVLASAPHRSTETVDVRAWVLRDGVPQTCAAGPAGLSSGDMLERVQPDRTSEVSADYLAASGFLPQYVNRTSAAFWAPEGSTIIVCIEYYNETGPEFRRPPFYEHQTVLESPDLMMPTVSVESVDLNRVMPADFLTLSAHVSGGHCGSEGWTGPSVEGRGESGDALGEATICFDQERPSVYVGGRYIDVAVRADVDVGGESITTTSVIRVSRVACGTECVLPPSSYYSVSLPLVEVPAGMCSGSGCAPPTREVSLGTAQLRLDWVQGNQNGRASWLVGPSEEGPTDRPLSRYANYDRRSQLSVSRNAEDPTTFDVTYHLVTDRPVSYTAWLATGCSVDGTVAEVAGTTTASETILDAHSAVLVFSRICAGVGATLSFELVDEAGNRALFGDHDGRSMGRGAPADEVWTPSFSTDLLVSYTVEQPLNRHFTYIEDFAITVEYQTVPFDMPELRCSIDNTLSATDQLVSGVLIGEYVTITIRVHLLDTEGGGPFNECLRWSSEPDTLILTATVNRLDLAREGVTLTSPEGATHRVSLNVRFAP